LAVERVVVELFATCHAFEEVVVEKSRALAQRTRPRDIYDVVHCYRDRNLIENHDLVYGVLEQKCAYKKSEVSTFASIQKHEKLDELNSQWSNMLAHQLPSLPPMESFWGELPAVFDWLADLQEVETLERFPVKMVRRDFSQLEYQMPSKLNHSCKASSLLPQIGFAFSWATTAQHEQWSRCHSGARKPEIVYFMATSERSVTQKPTD
jgi:hypothetical protein